MLKIAGQLTAVGLSEVLLADGQLSFPGDLPFSPHLMTQLKINEIILTGYKTKKKKKNQIIAKGT